MFKFGFDLFNKNLILNIVLITQLALAIVSTNIIIFIINTNKQNIKSISDFNSENIIFYMPDDLIEFENSKRNLIINELPDDWIIEDIKTSIVSDKKDNYLLVSYGEKTASLLNISTKNSCMILNSKNKVYINNKLEVFEIDKNSKYNKIILNIKNIKRSISNVLLFLGASNAPTAKTFFEKSNIYKNIPIILCVENNTIKNYSSSNNKIIYIPQNVKAEVKNQYISKMQNEAWVVSGANAYKETISELSQTLSFIIPIVLCLIFLGSIGLFCITSLSLLSNLKFYAVLTICGMKKSDLVLIEFQYISIIVFYSLLFTFGIFNLINDFEWFVLSDYTLTISNIVYSAVSILLIIVTNLTINKIFFKINEPLKIFRKN